MKDPNAAVKLVSFKSIIIGMFIFIKIPEVLLFLFIFSKLNPELTATFIPQESFASLIAGFSWLIISLTSVSLVLIIAGYYLLQKKNWARQVLEFVFWLLLGFIGINLFLLIRNLLNEGISSILSTAQIITLIPFTVIGALLIFNLYILRHRKFRRILQ